MSRSSCITSCVRWRRTSCSRQLLLRSSLFTSPYDKNCSSDQPDGITCWLVRLQLISYITRPVSTLLLFKPLVVAAVHIIYSPKLSIKLNDECSVSTSCSGADWDVSRWSYVNKPVTTVRGCVSTFVSVKLLDVFVWWTGMISMSEFQSSPVFNSLRFWISSKGFFGGFRDQNHRILHFP